MTITEQIQSLEAFLPQKDELNEDVSSQGVIWHLVHSMKVMNGILFMLTKSDPADYKKKMNMARTFVFNAGAIPRGQGKSPKAVIPTEEEMSEEGFYNYKELTEKLIPKIEALPEKSNFKHPVFGYLDKKGTLKFIEIHTEHHLKIIRDIVKVTA